MEPSICLPVSRVLLAYNEATAAQSQVDIMRRVLAAAGITHEIIVVKTVHTSGRRWKLCRPVPVACTNRGYGVSLKMGMTAMTYDPLSTYI